MYQSFLSLQSFLKIVLTLSNGLFCLMIIKILTLRKSYVASCHDPHGGTWKPPCFPRVIGLYGTQPSTYPAFLTPGEYSSNNLEDVGFQR